MNEIPLAHISNKERLTGYTKENTNETESVNVENGFYLVKSYSSLKTKVLVGISMLVANVLTCFITLLSDGTFLNYISSNVTCEK